MYGYGYGMPMLGMGYKPASTSNNVDYTTRAFTNNNNETSYWADMMRNNQKAWHEYRIEADRMTQDAEAAKKTRQTALEIKKAEDIRILRTKETQKVGAATLAARNLQVVLYSGKMDLLESAWNKFIAEIKKLPEVKEAYCDENGEFIDEKKLCSAAVSQYNSLLAEGGKDANLLADASMLPTAFTQGLWNGATWGFYTKDHSGTALKMLTGQDISKEDRVASEFGQLTGRAATTATALGTVGYLWNKRAAKNVEELLTIAASPDQYLDDIKEADKLAGVTEQMTPAQKNAAYKKIVDDASNDVATKTTAAEDAAKKLSDLDTKIADFNQTKKEAEDAITKLEGEIEDLNKKLASTPDDTTLQNELAKKTGELNTKKTQLGVVDGLIENANKKRTGLEQAKNAADDALEQAQDKLDNIKEKINKANVARANYDEATKQAKKATAKLNKLVSKEEASMVDDAVNAVKGGGSVSECSKALKAKKFGTKIGGRWGAAVGLALGLIGYGISKMNEA